MAGRPSTELGTVQPSYKPGVHLCDLAESLPDFAIAAIREAIPAFDKKIPGFAMEDAVLTGVETRTSSPIRIKRDKSFQSLKHLMCRPSALPSRRRRRLCRRHSHSAAVDGIKVAEAVALSLVNHRFDDRPFAREQLVEASS